MNYWHIQMNQPWGRNNIVINSKDMLLETPSVIGTGEWDDYQCRNFTDQNGDGMKIGDIVLVREGSQPIALCKVTSHSYKNEPLQLKYKNENYRSVKVLSFFNDLAKQLLQDNLNKYNSSYIQASGTLTICKNDNATFNFIREWNNQYNEQSEMNKSKILLGYKKQIILQGPPGTGKTRRAKEIAIEMLGLNDTEELKNNEQFKLIQFHPSYTYEDFVRGIVAKPNPIGGGVLYEAENKTLGEFARRAMDNYNDSKKAPEEISKTNWVRENYEKFKEALETELGEMGEIIIKNNTKPKIISIEENAIRVNRYSNENDSVLIKDSDIIEGYKGLNLSEPVVKIKENFILSKSARSGMYYLYQNLIEKFKKYLDENSLSFIQNTNKEKQELKPYILVIDEINRANLSSVLGELIYALEYRGEAVESMYDVDGKELILPPNLYIIGTMNTADRSVGHIDYAIRRRFAFVDVLPKDLSDDVTIKFDNELFAAIKNLFTPDDYKTRSSYLSNEFEPKDVALGHSYFIDKSDEGGSMAIRLEYEIKPILLEYIKDGILMGEDIKETINDLQASI